MNLAYLRFLLGDWYWWLVLFVLQPLGLDGIGGIAG